MKFCVLLVTLLGCSCSWAFESCSSPTCKDSCKNRCGKKLDKSFGCQCNDQCERFGDCCTDYNLCLYTEPSSESQHDHHSKPVATPDKNSCQGRCGEAYHKKDPCHCNKKCGKFNNCCKDYGTVCKGTGTAAANAQEPGPEDYSAGGDISQKEIEAVSESLYNADVNRAQESDLVLNKQHLSTGSGGREDQSDEPLYSYVNEELFKKPTYASFINLLNNYDRQTGTSDEHTKEEVKEQDNFLQEIMKTDVMRKLYTFFHQKKLYASQQEFVTDLKNMWFGLYCRGKGENDSSGFEHVFVGEVKKGKVSGFHSWIRYYMLEKQGLVDYYSHNYDGPWTSFPDVVGKQFHWDGYLKEVGSSFIGSSPEFDFAMYSLCFITRPGKGCKVSLGGHSLKIQTYTWTKSTYGDGKQYIATAYPVT